MLLMSKVIFEDYTIEVQNAIDVNIRAALEQAAGEMESAVKRTSRVDTGKTKNSFSHKITGDGTSTTAYIGSNYENAIWEEFGTGEYALQGGGRKGGWKYKDEKGNWHFTHGKRPSRAFYKAYMTTKSTVMNILQNALGGL